MRIYGQRTADDRLAFGGRGAPYHFASMTRPSFDRDARVHAALREVLVELFPVVADFEVTHEWGGALGIARDWHASVGLDRGRGFGWAGGYVGDGVATTNLAGRTLALARREWWTAAAVGRGPVRGPDGHAGEASEGVRPLHRLLSARGAASGCGGR